MEWHQTNGTHVFDTVPHQPLTQCHDVALFGYSEHYSPSLCTIPLPLSPTPRLLWSERSEIPRGDPLLMARV
jgi:hypothetical protein